MKKAFIIAVLLIITRTIGLAQSVGIGTTTPDASSVLELKATNKGFLPPRMSASEKGLIVAPKAGLMIYQTDGVTGLYVFNGSGWESVAGTATGSGWALNGNSGTNPASSFIGTRDNQPLKFRVNNTAAGELNSITGNTAFGWEALKVNTSGSQNTAIGTNSLNKNTAGHFNSGIGLGTLFNNTVGSNNTALGKTTMVSNVSGNNNLAAGSESLYMNVSGSSNVALGNMASYTSTDAGNVVAIGDSSLFYNIMSYNVGVGSKTLLNNTTGISNTALGSQSLTNNTIGFQNTAVGRTAMYANISGDQNTAVGVSASRYNESGNSNTALGFNSLFQNVASNNNTAVGHTSLAKTTSNDNTAVGKAALTENASGFSNTAIGVEALGTNTIGNYNTAIGYRANTWGTNFTNATAIGANSQAGCSDCVVLGSINGYNGATTTSKVGIGTTTPQKALHVNPNGAGGMMIGNSITTGGYTVMNMGISQASGGYSYIQSVKAAWPSSTYGSLVLNQNGGFVGIRTANPIASLHIKQYVDDPAAIDAGLRLERHNDVSHWDMAVDFGYNLSFSYNGVEKFYFDEVDGDMTTVSDLRMKKDIQAIETALPSIMKLEAKSYHYKDNAAGSRLSYGFIAQDVEKIFPDFVTTKGPDNSKAIGYQKLNVMAIKAIQEQQVIIDAQQQQIDEVKMQNALMMESIRKLEAAMEKIIGPTK